MGEVYLAEDTTLKRQVALKVLPPDLASSPDRLDRFQREAESLASLNHPNIVTIHSIESVDVGAPLAGAREGTSPSPTHQDTIRFLTMELVEGLTLSEMVAKGGLKLDQLFDIAVPLADALSAAHDKGVVHRDLKPSNVMVTADGRVKVLDFGLAKLLEEEPDLMATEMATEPLTQEGMAMGTMPYMSPEQVQGKPVDHRSDIFSLGIVLYEMTTGKRPFQGETSADVVSSILRDSPDSVTDLRLELPRHLGRIIRHCLEKDPQRRYQSALDVRNEIEGLRKEVESGELPVSSTLAAVPAALQPTKKRWLIPVALAALIAAAGVFWFVGRESGTPDEEVVEETTTAAEAEEASRQMIVVLPFENLGSAEDEYFAAGMTEEITSRLSSVSGIGVISRKSANQYAGSDKGIHQIGDELGVQYVLEGTVRWARSADGSRVRITPQLIRVQDDIQLWSDTYDRVIDDIFEVQSDIASQVIDQLGVTLLEPERESMEARPTENLEAYQAYLRGLDETGRLTYSAEARQLEIEMFERAVVLDPDFAQAWAALSKAHSGLINLGMDKSPERLAMAKEAVDRALALDPDLAEAHLAMAYYHYWGRRDYDPALEELAIAQRDLPDHPDVLIADFAIKRRQGRLEESLESIQRAFELSPREDDLLREISVILYMMRDFEGGLRYLDQSIALAPDQQAAYFFKALGHWLLGQPEMADKVLEEMPQMPGAHFSWIWVSQALMNRDWQGLLEIAENAPEEVFVAPDAWVPASLIEAEALLRLGETARAQEKLAAAQETTERQLAMTPEDPRPHSTLGILYSLQGKGDEAIREGKRALELYPPSKDALHGPRQLELLARIYANLGEATLAAEQLDQLLSQPSWSSVAFLELDPFYDPIRQAPEFQELLEKYR